MFHLSLWTWVVFLPRLSRLTSLDMFSQCLLALQKLMFCSWQTNPASPSNLTRYPRSCLDLVPQTPTCLRWQIGSHYFPHPDGSLGHLLLFHGDYFFYSLMRNQSRKFLICLSFQSCALNLSLQNFGPISKQFHNFILILSITGTLGEFSICMGTH